MKYAMRIVINTVVDIEPDAVEERLRWALSEHGGVNDIDIEVVDQLDEEPDGEA